MRDLDSDHIGDKLARLYPKHADLAPATGTYVPAWRREDSQAIAGAIGMYVAADPIARRLPSILLQARCWPEGLDLDTTDRLHNTTVNLLLRSYGPHWDHMPTKVQAKLSTSMDLIAQMLLMELVKPATCSACKGGGITNGDTCTLCNGTTEGPTGFRARAAHLRMSPYQWRRYGQKVYDRTLKSYRAMADQASRGVIEALG